MHGAISIRSSLMWWEWFNTEIAGNCVTHTPGWCWWGYLLGFWTGAGCRAGRQAEGCQAGWGEAEGRGCQAPAQSGQGRGAGRPGPCQASGVPGSARVPSHLGSSGWSSAGGRSPVWWCGSDTSSRWCLQKLKACTSVYCPGGPCPRAPAVRWSHFMC